MEENQKIHIKLGDLEFEAEGDASSVSEALARFEALVAARPEIAAQLPRGTAQAMPDEQEDGGEDASEHHGLDLGRYFSVDGKRRLVTLRLHPSGPQRNANAILLVLYGFLELLNEEDVLVGRVKDALEQSGIQPSRIDKAIAPHQRAGLVLRGGKPGPGGKYRLSNTGIAEAERLLNGLA